MADLISDDLVSVRRMQSWLEVEIRTDVLFPSASAALVSDAVPIMTKLAHTLQPFPNPIRIEGYTDNLPINSDRFPSNWELSAARAASVARLFTSLAIDPKRLTVTGYGEFRPIADNKTAEGRDKNRRVVLVVLAAPPKPDIPQNSMEENAQQSVPVAPIVEPIKTALPIEPLGH
jgi:chemotaxis protein MotB